MEVWSPCVACCTKVSRLCALGTCQAACGETVSQQRPRQGRVCVVVIAPRGCCRGGAVLLLEARRLLESLMPKQTSLLESWARSRAPRATATWMIPPRQFQSKLCMLWAQKSLETGGDESRHGSAFPGICERTSLGDGKQRPEE